MCYLKARSEQMASHPRSDCATCGSNTRYVPCLAKFVFNFWLLSIHCWRASPSTRELNIRSTPKNISEHIEASTNCQALSQHSMITSANVKSIQTDHSFSINRFSTDIESSRQFYQDGTSSMYSVERLKRMMSILEDLESKIDLRWGKWIRKGLRRNISAVFWKRRKNSY